ncbi:hypothetical protein AX15_000306 [Amanita polypyramis BW_CC]|nr:hypothetical protein AX15_000306 [Amanita polypyramis BW_CC]
MTDSLLRAESGRNRSDTRSSSNPNTQHSRRTSFNPSVHSWVLSAQQNPPPPPPDHVITPLRATRPLPEHPYANMVRSQGPLSQPPLQVMNPSDADDDYYHIDEDDVRLSSGFMAEGPGRIPGHVVERSNAAPGAQSETRSRSFVGGFVRGLKTIPKKVLRYRNSSEKRRPALIAEEAESTEAVTTLPRYRSNPSTPIAGPSMVTYVQATDMPVPELHERLPADALRSVRPRHPSYRVMPPPVHGLAEEQTAQIYDMPPMDPPTFQESTRVSTPPPEADRATMLYYDNPADATSTSGPPQSQSLHISYISHHTPNTRAATLNPATPQHVPSQLESEVQENPTSSHSPVLARPPLSTDYRKMSLNSHDATSRTTPTTSCSLEPSFSSELSPVKRFLHILHSLPWVATERITSDYHPGGSDKDIPKKKPMISWYRHAGGRNGGPPVDLLSAGSADSQTGRPQSNSDTVTSVASPRLEVRRVRRSHSHLQPQRHQHSHGRHQRHHHHHHHHRHSHTRHRHRRRSASTESGDDDIPDTHKPNNAHPPVYPSPFPYAYPYPIPPVASPRGPRSRRSPAYPGGYVPFQPMPPTPPPVQMPIASPVYVFAPNGQSQGSGLGDGFAVPGQPMYVVPGGFHPNGHGMGSPTPSDQAPASNISYSHG